MVLQGSALTTSYLKYRGRDYRKNREQKNDAHTYGSCSETIRLIDEVFIAVPCEILPSRHPQQENGQDKNDRGQRGEQ